MPGRGVALEAIERAVRASVPLLIAGVTVVIVFAGTL
jgi:hypothetical protein